jgi:hypothetical protein
MAHVFTRGVRDTATVLDSASGLLGVIYQRSFSTSSPGSGASARIQSDNRRQDYGPSEEEELRLFSQASLDPLKIRCRCHCVASMAERTVGATTLNIRTESTRR